MQPGRAPKLAAGVTLVFMVALFFQMLRTLQTHRWRRYFFVALGFLFPVGFIWELFALRGSMSISPEKMLSGDTPFCFLAIPMMILPAALTRTVIFPGSILPTASNPHAVASMVAVWLAATLVLGKGWCSYGCFFGGIEEGFSAVPRKPRIRHIDPRWRWMPWAVLAAVVLLAAATLEPVYCTWLCPFKAVTEYLQVRSFETVVQAGIFIALFLGLVVVLPLLTQKRTQCSFLCPFGAFQSIFNKTSVFDIRIDRSKCKPCVLCEQNCPTLSIGPESIQAGQPRMSCMKCGACVDVCRRDAAVWHIKGTEVGAAPERARLLHLYSAWAFAVMFGGSIIANSLAKIFGVLI
jgi:ferredoxin